MHQRPNGYLCTISMDVFNVALVGCPRFALSETRGDGEGAIFFCNPVLCVDGTKKKYPWSLTRALTRINTVAPEVELMFLPLPVYAPLIYLQQHPRRSYLS